MSTILLLNVKALKAKVKYLMESFRKLGSGKLSKTSGNFPKFPESFRVPPTLAVSAMCLRLEASLPVRNGCLEIRQVFSLASSALLQACGHTSTSGPNTAPFQ